MNNPQLFTYIMLILGMSTASSSAIATNQHLDLYNSGLETQQPKRIGGPLDVRKHHNHYDLTDFESTGRLDTYKDSLSYKTDGPFGVYVATERSSGTKVGICSFSAHEKADIFFAEPVIDVLEAHRGKDYGTELLKSATQKVAGELDKRLDCTRNFEPRSRSFLPMTMILSSVEWEFGSNHAALKIHTNAGYGLIGLSDESGLVAYAVYPATHPAAWDADKLGTFTRISKAISTNLERKEDDGSKASEDVLKDTQSFLEMLDLSQETEILTLSIFKKNAARKLGAATNQVIDHFLSGLDKSVTERFNKLASGERLPLETQRFPLDVFSYWRHDVFQILLPKEQQ